VDVNLVGESYMKWEMYDIFDIVPFLLLDNALKYSPPDQTIDVKFREENNSFLSVNINSFGPNVKDEEIDLITDRKYRGSNASKFESAGGGYGLYLANLICNLHDVDLSVSSGDVLWHREGIPISEFNVELVFER
jgi:signal transduction histidine kinase